MRNDDFFGLSKMIFIIALIGTVSPHCVARQPIGINATGMTCQTLESMALIPRGGCGDQNNNDDNVEEDENGVAPTNGGTGNISDDP